MPKTEKDRLEAKTVEELFLDELEDGFELAPRTSRAILETAKTILLQRISGNSLKPGQIRKVAISANEPHGKPLKDLKKIEVVLTLDAGIEDLDVHYEFGVTALRHNRILRLTEEAVEQNALLTQEDLARLLNVNVRTIRRDIDHLRKRGYVVHTRGYDKGIGKGPSHKAKIVELYLQGDTYSEIKLKTRHSYSAIERYIETFGRVVLSLRRGIKEVDKVGYLIGISQKLAEEYLGLYGRYYKRYQERIEEIIERLCGCVKEVGIDKKGILVG